MCLTETKDEYRVAPNLVDDKPATKSRMGEAEVLLRQNKLPISRYNRGEAVANGHFAVCLRSSFLNGDGKSDESGESEIAVKLFLPPHETYSKEGEPPSAFECAVQDRVDYEQTVEAFGPDLIVPTLFVVCSGLGGKISEVAIQPWIKGKPVGEYTVEEISNNLPMLYSLRNFMFEFLRHWLKKGEVVDYWGFGSKRGESLFTRFNAFSVLAARNLIWSENRLALIDPIRHRALGGHELGWKHRIAIVVNWFRECVVLRNAFSELKNQEVERKDISPELVESVQTIVDQLETLKRKFGLDYRIVGGFAAAGILDTPLSILRKDGTKRDLDVLILNPEVCLPELTQLDEWAENMFRGRFHFPRLSLNLVNEDDVLDNFKSLLPFKHIFQAVFRNDGDDLYICNGAFRMKIPTEARKVHTINFHGVELPSFPYWFHYILYITRNSGFIRSKDKEKVNSLKAICFNFSLGPELVRSVTVFNNKVRRKNLFKVMANSTRLSMSLFWNKLAGVKRLVYG